MNNKANIIRFFIMIIIAMLSSCVQLPKDKLQNPVDPPPTALQCNLQADPVGLDTAQPNFGWQLLSQRRGMKQSAWQLMVASSSELLAAGDPDMWDSGRIISAQSQYNNYKGKPLQSSQRYYWRVRIWNEKGKATSWSEPSSFVTGILSPHDWQAFWITSKRTDKDPLPLFRKEFQLDKKLTQAVIHICGLGQYELHINGKRVGDNQLDPGWTNYHKTCLYSSYDVTDLFRPGANALGVMLGNGMYNVPGGRYTRYKDTFGPPKLICQMHLIFADGSTEIIKSDETWKSSPGPITFTCIFGGEDYDAQREQPGWDQPGFEESKWHNVVLCRSPGGKLVAQYAPPVKVIRYLSGKLLGRLENGQLEIDCGLNLSARPVVKVKGPAGSKFTIYCAEKRGQPWVWGGGHTYTYTLKGRGEEVFRPRFTYFGFQYLYIAGADWNGSEDKKPDHPLLLEVGSEFLTSSAPATGAFKCSNKLFNEIDAMVDRSVRSNLQSILTDCPHREKLGWLEVSHLMGPSIMYHYDVHRLYRKISRDTSEAQLDNGLVPDFAPEYIRLKGGFFESPEWGSACVQLPELLYKWYDDTLILKQQYDTMTRYTRYLAQTRNDQGLAKPGLGDWYNWTAEKSHAGASQLTPVELPGTAFLYDNARFLAQVARLLQRYSDTEQFESLAQQVRRDFIKAYYHPDEKSVATGSQASLATALYYDLVPEQDRPQVLANLVAKIEEAQYRQSTGEVCFRMLVQCLADAGRSDVVYRMINRTDPPGYGNMLRLGYKTLSETWDKAGSSMNHCMFGHIQEWFQKSILGISQTPDSLGFQHLLLRPEPVGDLTRASGYYDSIHGRIVSNWEITRDSFHWRIIVPANTSAEVYVPTCALDKITESGQPASLSPGVKFLRMEPASGVTPSFSHAVFALGSGEYQFSSMINE